MIDLEKYNRWFRKEGFLSSDEMYEALDEKFTCPRCGRPDLPLALFPHHDKSCVYECRIAGSAIDHIELLERQIESLRDRVQALEVTARDALRTIHWFGGWLNNRKEPVTYDRYYVPCKQCGVMGNDHVDADHGYEHSTYSVSYAARDVAIMCNSICKALGPSAMAPWAEFRCEQCQGLFEGKHMGADSDSFRVRCKWCHWTAVVKSP